MGYGLGTPLRGSIRAPVTRDAGRLSTSYVIVGTIAIQLVAFLLLVAMPGAPSSFLFLVVRPGALSSVLAPTIAIQFRCAITVTPAGVVSGAGLPSGGRGTGDSSQVMRFIF